LDSADNPHEATYLKLDCSRAKKLLGWFPKLKLATALEWVVQWYNQRGECSENRIKDLKIGFGMERMPCGQYEANAIFFRIVKGDDRK
jgi:dTDP-D-glucose 4,6-dehydratase